MRTLVAAVLLLPVLAAGCVSSEGSEQDVGPVASGEALDENAASILGVVVDDAQTPMAGALVALVDLNLRAETDASGAFQFLNIAPGSHEINALKLGFMSAGRRVDVEAGQKLEGVILTLQPIVLESIYHETFGPLAGYFECMVGTPGGITACTGDRLHGQPLAPMLFPNEKRMLEFTMSAEHWKTMIGESRWTQGSASTGQGMAIYPSYSKRDGSHWWCEADGASPLLYRFEADGEGNICTSQGEMDPAPSAELNPLVVVADPGFGSVDDPNRPPMRVMVQQKFELLSTVFYGEKAPAEFSALKDL